LACLKKLYNKAIDWGYTQGNPVSRIQFFSEKNNLKERVLSVEEENRLMKSSVKHLKPILITAIQTGMRRSEIFNLKWTAVDFTKKEIKVENSKSGLSRIIPINSELLVHLKKLKNKANKSKWVFLNHKTGKPFKDVKKAFQGACRREGIEDLRFHDLRHTFASRLVQRGVDLITIKDLLGHSSVRVTERYTHSNRDLKKAAVETLNRKSEKMSKKPADLLRICDMKGKEQTMKSVTGSFSIN